MRASLCIGLRVGLRFGAATLILSAVSGCSSTVDGNASDAGGADMAPTSFGDPLTFPIEKFGPYSVGYREISTNYTPPGEPSPRSVKVSFWYPTTSPSGANPNYGPLMPDADAFTDAPPAPPAFPSGYPVLVHSHSIKGWVGDNAHYARHLASHGWAVIAPEHKGNTYIDTPDKLPLALYLARPLDVRAALDLAAALPASDPLAGKFDFKRIAMSGHSYGTYTAAIVAGTRLDSARMRADCQSGGITKCSEAGLTALDSDLSEPRVRLIIALASPLHGYLTGSPYNPRHIPVLSMFGTLNYGGQLELQASTSGSEYIVFEVKGGCHQMFNLGQNFVGDLGNSSGTPCREISDEEGFALVRAYQLAYLRQHILDDKSPEIADIVSGKKSLSPRETVHLK